MDEWPKLGTQSLPTGMRLLLLLASAAAALLIALALELGFVGALLIDLVLTPLTDFRFPPTHPLSDSLLIAASIAGLAIG